MPNFSPTSGLQTDRSDYVAGLYLSPFSGVNLVAQGRFDEKDWTLRRQDTHLQGNYGPLLASDRLHLSRVFEPDDPGMFDTQQEVITATLGLRLTDTLERAGPDALRHRRPRAGSRT